MGCLRTRSGQPTPPPMKCVQSRRGSTDAGRYGNRCPAGWRPAAEAAAARRNELPDNILDRFIQPRSHDPGVKCTHAYRADDDTRTHLQPTSMRRCALASQSGNLYMYWESKTNIHWISVRLTAAVGLRVAWLFMANVKKTTASLLLSGC